MSIAHIRVCGGCGKHGGLADVDWIKIEQHVPPEPGRRFSQERRWDYCSTDCFLQSSRQAATSVVPASREDARDD